MPPKLPKKMLYLIVIFGLAMGGFVLMEKLKQMYKAVLVQDSILINRSVSDTFAYVTYAENIGHITENLSEIEASNIEQLRAGSQYQQTLLVHGNANPQTVTVLDYESDSLYVTQTELFGFKITYSYHFIEMDNQQTRIELSKQAEIEGFWNILRPLLHHLLTAPDHDGEHLTVLKAAVESMGNG